MTKVDISSEAVERAIAMAGLHGLHGTQAILRAQAERIKFHARNDALREALSCIDNGDDVKLGGDHPDWFVHRYNSLKDLIEGDTND